MNQLFVNVQNLIVNNTKIESENVNLVSEKSDQLLITIETVTDFKFTPVTSKTHGKLKSNIQKVPKSDFNKYLEYSVKENQLQSKAHVEVWMEDEGKALGSVIKSNKVINYKTIFGYEETCSNCQGFGEIGCRNCQESGQVRCNTCGGLGQSNCHSCGGSGYGRCSKCGGGGRNGNTYCSICKGSGRGGCNTCGGMFGGTGKVMCRGCGGRREVVCGSCGGNGKINCSSCETTGVISTLGTTEFNAVFSHTLSYPKNSLEIADLIESLKLSTLVGLGKLFFVSFTYDECKLLRAYKETLNISEINIQISGQDKTIFNIKAYGPELIVYDYKNLFAKLLEKDVHDLESALSLNCFFNPTNQSKLVEASNKFLESEVHQKISFALVSNQKYSDLNIAGMYNQKSYESLKSIVSSMVIKLIFPKSIAPLILYQLLLSLSFCAFTFNRLEFGRNTIFLIYMYAFISFVLMVIRSWHMKMYFKKFVSLHFWEIYKNSKVIKVMIGLWCLLSLLNFWLLVSYVLPIINPGIF